MNEDDEEVPPLTRAQMHAQNNARFLAIEGELHKLNAIFDQVRGGLKVLYFLGGFTVGASIFGAFIWSLFKKP